MAKKKRRKPSHAYKGCPEETRELTGVDRELDKARIWQARQMNKRLYWKLKRRIAEHGLLAVYREWKAGRKSG